MSSVYAFNSLVKCHTAHRMLKLEPYRASALRGVWISGGPGSGKSWSVREYCALANLTLYVKTDQQRWLTGYAGEKVILQENVDNAHKELVRSQFLVWADIYPATAEYKSSGVRVELQHDFFIITSCLTIDEFVSTLTEREQGEVRRRFREFTVEQFLLNIEAKYGTRPTVPPPTQAMMF